jgi:hypothetical protein
MRRNVDYFYKSYDGTPTNDLERRTMEYFNDYGYNLETNRRRIKAIDDCSKKSGPNCLQRHLKREKG